MISRAVVGAVVVVACAGCPAEGLSALPLPPDAPVGLVELTDTKQLVLHVDPLQPPQRFFVPVDTRGSDLDAVVDIVANVDAPIALVVAGHPEQTSPSLAWSVIEDDLRLSFDLDDLGGARLPGVELGVGATDSVVDVDLALRLRVTSDDPAATAAFGPLEPHPL